MRNRVDQKPAWGDELRKAPVGRAMPVQINSVERNRHVPIYADAGDRDASMPSTGFQRAVFLDRDGVLVEDVHFLREPGQLKLLPGVSEGLRQLQDRFLIIIATNQSGIARGLFTEDDLLDIHLELARRLYAEGAMVDAFYYCPHLPEATVAAHRLKCECRKPSPGMLIRAADEFGIKAGLSFMIGDSERDIQAARAAGVKGILVSADRGRDSKEDAVATDFLDAVRQIGATPRGVGRDYGETAGGTEITESGRWTAEKAK